MSTEDLSEELDEGQKAARALVEHLLCMGAAQATIPVVVDDETYLVSVTHKPIQA